MTDELHIAAAMIVDADARHLLVRKAGTSAFMQAGGKIEPGESPASALIRELREELGLVVDAEALSYRGVRRAVAANEDDTTLRAHVFELQHNGPVTPDAEIADTAWVEPGAGTGLDLAPLSRALLDEEGS